MKRIDTPEVERRLRRLKLWRVVFGILAMLAIAATVAAGVTALLKEEDSWVAMRLPFGSAIVLLSLFARCAKSIVDAHGGIGHEKRA